MAELQRQHDEALAKLQAYQDREAVMLKGVLPEFAEFAGFQVRRQVTDDSDFDARFDKWQDKYSICDFAKRFCAGYNQWDETQNEL